MFKMTKSASLRSHTRIGDPDTGLTKTTDSLPLKWLYACRVAAALIGLVLPTVAAAQNFQQEDATDKVTLQPEGKTSRVTFTCRILDYTGEKITVLIKLNGEERTFPASTVVSTETVQTGPHVKGQALFLNGRTAAAEKEFVRALEIEPRKWVRREILALLIRCDLVQGEYESAGSRFLSLTESDPVTRHFKLMPLAWRSGAKPQSLVSSAARWVKRSDPIAQLVGASWLLDDAKYGDLAQTTLKQLSLTSDRRLRELAGAQLWRLRVREGNVNDLEADRWEGQIERIPADLRGGPYYVLGMARLSRREYAKAATALLWLPLVYRDDHLLASRAALEAGRALERDGQRDEAATMYREVVFRYRDTEFAQDAAALLKKATADSSGVAPSSATGDAKGTDADDDTIVIEK